MERFDEFMERALYGPDGFYTKGRGAGRSGRDFVTSPEVGPLFGAVIADVLDGWWTDLGRPDLFHVHEWGAGPGTLRRAINVAAPACAAALAYVEIEIHDSAPLMPPHVVLANELLDNIAVRVIHGDQELFVSDNEPRWRPVVDPAALPTTVDAPAPLATRAREWVQARLAELEPGGHLLVFDYGGTTESIAGQPDSFLRTYRGHTRGSAPWHDVGDQDITADVPFDQLPEPSRLVAQADWLRAHGIDQLVSEGRQEWEANLAAPTVASVRGKSRAIEAKALTDPTGLGGFLVAEWNTLRASSTVDPRAVNQ